MVKCPGCQKEMDKGIFVARAAAGNVLGAVRIYWCKKEGLFKAEDKVPLGLKLAGFGIKHQADICKDCRNMLVKY